MLEIGEKGGGSREIREEFPDRFTPWLEADKPIPMEVEGLVRWLTGEQATQWKRVSETIQAYASAGGKSFLRGKANGAKDKESGSGGGG